MTDFTFKRRPTPVTAGKLIELLQSVPSETPIGFRNQPEQETIITNYAGEILFSFQPKKETGSMAVRIITGEMTQEQAKDLAEALRKSIDDKNNKITTENTND